jgi:ATP-dependent DNA helicase Q1
MLRLLALVDACFEPFTAAESGKTVFFSSPLYRKNLHYKVIQKPSKESDHLTNMVNYILDNYPGESGIVYCTTRLVSLQPHL